MNFRNILDKLLEYFLITLLIVLVIDVAWQVLSRYILKSPSSFTDELARILLIWVGILGAAYLTGKKMHLAIDFFINKFPKKWEMYVNHFINLSIFSFALFVMVIGGINLMYILIKLGNISPALSLPIGYIYSVIPISGLLILYYVVSDSISIIRKPNKTVETEES